MTRFAGRNTMGQMAAALVGAAAAQAACPVCIAKKIEALERQAADVFELAEQVCSANSRDGMVWMSNEHIKTALELLPHAPVITVFNTLFDMVGELLQAEAHESSDDHYQNDGPEADKHRGCAESLARDLVLANQKGQQQ